MLLSAGLDAVLHPERHRDAARRLGGPERLSMGQVSEELSEALGEAIRHTNPGMARFAARLRGCGAGRGVVCSMPAVHTRTRLNQNQPITGGAERLLGEPTSGAGRVPEAGCLALARARLDLYSCAMDRHGSRT